MALSRSVRPMSASLLLAPTILAVSLAALAASTASAQVAYVDAQGREWREVDGVTNFTWEQIDAICPTDGATPCVGTLGGVDLTGWVWATDEQVTELFAEFVPAIVDDPSLGGPAYVLAGLFFFGSFDPTFEFYSTFGGYNYLSGWTATESDGLAVIPEVSATWNAFDSVWNVAAQTSVTTSSPYRGIWLVHIPVQPCPTDLDGNGAVDAADLGLLLSVWGTPPRPSSADLNNDGLVDAADLGILLAAWGEC